MLRGRKTNKRKYPQPRVASAEEYEIEKILAYEKARIVTLSIIVKKTRRYLVSWRGYPEDEDSWVETEDMKAPELLAEFWARGIPQHNAKGHYSQLLKPSHEQHLIAEIVEEFKSTGWDQLLFIIRTQATNWARLSPWNHQFSTLEGCTAYIKNNPEYAYILSVVHEKRAYAWFCESIAAQHPSQPSPTLLEYLLPTVSFTDAYPTIKMIINRGPSITGSSHTSTHAFDPGATLNWNRIPYQVLRCDLLPAMRRHLEQIVKDRPASGLPISVDAQSTYRATIKGLDRRVIVNEGDVSEVFHRLVPVVERTYTDLTGNAIVGSNQLTTDRRTVVTDHALRLSLNGSLAVLIEAKAPAVFERHAKQLHDELPETEDPIKYNLTRWENWRAILAKLAWHSSDSPQKPHWAIVFGGEGYFIVLIVYIKDQALINRPILFCSPIHSIYEFKLPFTSVLLYAVLTASLPQNELLLCLELAIPRERTIPAVEKPPDLNFREYEQADLKGSCLYIRVDQPNVTPRKMARISSTNPSRVKRKVMEDTGVSAIVEPQPIITLCEKAIATGAAGTTWRSKDGQLVVKVSELTKESKSGLLKEHRLYGVDGLGLSRRATNYGIFTLGYSLALILSYEGESRSFDLLSNGDRQVIDPPASLYLSA